jgi:PilZ domain
MAPERRKFPRLKTRGVSAHLRVRDEVLALGLPIDNLSLGGLFVRTSKPLPVGTLVVLELVRPGMAALKLTGATVCSLGTATRGPEGGGPGMGIRFDALSVEATTRLNRLLVELVLDRGAGPKRGNLQPPRRIAVPAHGVHVSNLAAAKPAEAALGVDESARLMVQVRGLLQELGEAQQALERRGRELADVRSQLSELRRELERRDARVSELEGRLGFG